MTLDKRLSRLESRCRFLSRVIVAIVAAICLTAFVGASNLALPQKLQVSELEVVDSKGNVRIRLGEDAESKKGQFDIFLAKFTDEHGKVGAVILDKGQILLTQGDSQLVLAAYGNGATVQASAKGLRPRAMFYAFDDHAGIQLRDTNGEISFIQDTPKIRVPGPRAADPFGDR
jgi:hypothetical protein